MRVSPELYPFRTRDFDVGDARMSYVDEGSGPPVVMVHGNPSWSFYYRHLIDDLRRDHRVIAPDHIGMGLSEKPTSGYPYTLARRVADFTALMEALDFGEPITLVVHDWGGMIALAWAVEHPEQVGRLVIFNTAAFPLPDGRGLPFVLRLARMPVLSELAIRGGNAFAVGASWLGVRDRMAADVRGGYVAPYGSWQERVAIHRFVQDIPVRADDPAYPVLARTSERLGAFADRPVLICWGRRDPAFGAWCLDCWTGLYPQAEVHAFDAGHYVLEDESARIVPLVRDFLSR